MCLLDLQGAADLEVMPRNEISWVVICRPAEGGHDVGYKERLGYLLQILQVRSLAGGDDHHRSLQYRLQSRTRRLSAKGDVDATVGVLAEHRF